MKLLLLLSVIAVEAAAQTTSPTTDLTTTLQAVLQELAEMRNLAEARAVETSASLETLKRAVTDVQTRQGASEKQLHYVERVVTDIQGRQSATERQLNNVEQVATAIGTRQGAIEKQLTNVEQVATKIDTRQETIKKQLNNVEKQLGELKVTVEAQHVATTSSLNDLKIGSQGQLKTQEKITANINQLANSSNSCCLTMTSALSILTQPSTTPVPSTTITKTPPTTTLKPYITDCSVHVRSGSVKNGVYPVNVYGLFETRAWCNNGHTVIQRRKFDDMAFDKTWNEYAAGFGKPESDHWMGLDHQHVLTRDRTCQLQVQIVVDAQAPDNIDNCRKYGWHDCNGQMRHITGDNFRVSSSFEKFRISIKFNSTDFIQPDVKYYFSTSFNGNAFTTKDRVNHAYPTNCATYQAVAAGGFWYHNYCYPGFPNIKWAASRCSKTNKICGYWHRYMCENTLLQFTCR